MRDHITPLRVFIFAIIMMFALHLVSVLRETKAEIRLIEKATRCDFIEMNRIFGSVAYFYCDNQVVLKRVN